MKPLTEISSNNRLFNSMGVLRIQNAFLELREHLKIVIRYPKESFFLKNSIFQSSIMHSHSVHTDEVPILYLALCFALQGKEIKDSPCFEDACSLAACYLHM